MSERKVLNKYYPPDFDPSKIPRLRLPRDRQYTVRLMAPCNMRCTTCGEYIYKGKKFNARKETVQNEEYLGIKIFRFYIKCPRCLAEITFKTDPENADYIVEHGASRNFQALKLAEEAAAKEARELEEEEKNNPMKLLENRTKASKQEMELMEALEELKDLNQRHAKVDIENLLQDKQQQLVDEIQKQEDEDEALVRTYFGKYKGQPIKYLVEDSDSLLSESSKEKNQAKKPKLTVSKTGTISKKTAASFVKPKSTSKPESKNVTHSPVNIPQSTQQADNNTAKSSEQSSSNALNLLTAYSDSGSESG